MMRLLTIYNLWCLLALLPLLAACSASDDDSSSVANGTAVVNFEATMAKTGDQTTRAANQVDELATMQDAAYPGFGVFACYTGLHGYSDSNVHPDFMYNERVQWDGTSSLWVYSPLKYWPNGEGEAAANMGSNPHFVSFMAYAPWSDGKSDNPAGYCIPSFSLQGEIGNPWLTYRLHENVANQVDLLYAPSQLDQKKPLAEYRIPFEFKHALACVGDEVNIVCSDAIKSQLDSRVRGSSITNAMVVVTGIQIEYTLTSKARLVLWNQGEANWQTIWSENPICTRTVSILDPDDDADNETVYAYNTSIPTAITTKNKWTGNGVFYIPIELTGYAQTATVSVTHCIATYSGSSWKYDVEKTGTATVNLHDYRDAYKSGKHLFINVTLNQVDIALTAAIAPWDIITQEVEGIED